MTKDELTRALREALHPVEGDPAWLDPGPAARAAPQGLATPLGDAFYRRIEAMYAPRPTRRRAFVAAALALPAAAAIASLVWWSLPDDHAPLPGYAPRSSARFLQRALEPLNHGAGRCPETLNRRHLSGEAAPGRLPGLARHLRVAFFCQVALK